MGTTLAVGLEGGDVIVADFPGGGDAARIPFPANIRRLAYSPDGQLPGGRGREVGPHLGCPVARIRDPRTGPSR